MRSLILLLLLILSLVYFRQEIKAAGKLYQTKKHLAADSSAVRLRIPSAGKSLDSYRLDKDFIYDDVPHSPGISESVRAWIMDKLQKFMEFGPVSFIFRHFNYVIIAAALTIVIFIIRKLKMTGIIYSRQEAASGDIISFDGENIQAINPDSLIAEAIEKKQYRTAIRYCYIKSLKMLGDTSLVELKSNKTNSQYIKELKEPELKKSFQELTNVFEWIWYGELPVEYDFFEQARNHFDNFNRLVAANR